MSGHGAQPSLSGGPPQIGQFGSQPSNATAAPGPGGFVPPGSSQSQQRPGPGGPPDTGFSVSAPPDSRSFGQQHTRSFSQGNVMSQPSGSSPQQQQQQQPYSRNSAQDAPRYGNGGPTNAGGPPQLGALPFQGG